MWPEDNCWGKPSKELLQNSLEVIKCKLCRVCWQATRFCSRVSHSNANSTWAGSRKDRDKKNLLPDAWWDLQMRSHSWTSCRYQWPRCVPTGSPQAPAKALQWSLSGSRQCIFSLKYWYLGSEAEQVWCPMCPLLPYLSHCGCRCFIWRLSLGGSKKQHASVRPAWLIPLALRKYWNNSYAFY